MAVRLLDAHRYLAHHVTARTPIHVGIEIVSGIGQAGPSTRGQHPIRKYSSHVQRKYDSASRPAVSLESTSVVVSNKEYQDYLHAKQLHHQLNESIVEGQINSSGRSQHNRKSRK